MGSPSRGLHSQCKRHHISEIMSAMTQHLVISCYKSNEVQWGESMARILKPALVGSTVDSLVEALVGPLYCRHLLSGSSLNSPCVRESFFGIWNIRNADSDCPSSPEVETFSELHFEVASMTLIDLVRQTHYDPRSLIEMVALPFRSTIISIMTVSTIRVLQHNNDFGGPLAVVGETNFPTCSTCVSGSATKKIEIAGRASYYNHG